MYLSENNAGGWLFTLFFEKLQIKLFRVISNYGMFKTNLTRQIWKTANKSTRQFIMCGGFFGRNENIFDAGGLK